MNFGPVVYFLVTMSLSLAGPSLRLQTSLWCREAQEGPGTAMLLGKHWPPRDFEQVA